MKKHIALFWSALLISMFACTLAVPGTEPTKPITNALHAQEVQLYPSVAPTPIRSAIVTADVLNIRREAKYHSNTTGKYLHEGQIVVILECSAGWAKIGENQWVRSYYLHNGCSNE